MNIGSDFDDVLAHTHLVKVEIAQELFGVNIHPNNFNRENLIGHILNEEEYKEISKVLFTTERYWPEVPNAISTLQQLMEIGHKVKVITSRSSAQGNLVAAEKWLRDHNLSLEITGVGYGISKLDATRGLDVFIDDDVEKLEPMIGTVPHLLLFSWPHDRYSNVSSSITLVSSWFEIYDYIQRV